MFFKFDIHMNLNKTKNNNKIIIKYYKAYLGH